MQRHALRAAASALLALGLLTGGAALAPAGAAPRSPPASGSLARMGVLAQQAPRPDPPARPRPPITPTPKRGTSGDSGGVTVDLGGTTKQPSQSVVIILALTVLSIAPALLMMLTSFTRVVIVLSITRNALGLTAIPPNQVIVGLALFLSLFIMSPTLAAMNHDGLQPLLKGTKAPQAAIHDAEQPLKRWLLKQTRKDELALFIKASGKPAPKNPAALDLTTLAPAFILSELKTAFIIGFIVFIPFLVIDLLVSSTLMSMGLMMLPPVLISLPFKLLLFVMVDGWGLIVRSLISSYR